MSSTTNIKDGNLTQVASHPLKLGESITDRLIKIHSNALDILKARKTLIESEYATQPNVLDALKLLSGFYSDLMIELTSIHIQSQAQL